MAALFSIRVYGQLAQSKKNLALHWLLRSLVKREMNFAPSFKTAPLSATLDALGFTHLFDEDRGSNRRSAVRDQRPIHIVKDDHRFTTG